MKTLALLEILGIISNITILIALISFIGTERQRRNAEVYQAWQVITAAYDQPGSGGRIEALEFLNSEPRRFPWFWLRWERQSLQGLAAPEAYLTEINLQDANLSGANLQDVDLLGANRQDAVLASDKNLNLKIIKSACFWERAIYVAKINVKQWNILVIEPDNANFIAELKKNKSSDPKVNPDCGVWNKS